MPPAEETPITGETNAAEVNGSPEDTNPSTPVSEAPKAEETKQVDEAEVWRKKAQQAEMRANQLENAQKKAEEDALKEQNRYKELWEKAESERQEREAQEEAERREQETLSIRDNVINEYPNETVKKMALKLTAKNKNALLWNGVVPEDDAKAEVIEMLNALAEEVGQPSGEPTGPRTEGSNPLPETQTSRQETREERIARLEKSLEGKVI